MPQRVAAQRLRERLAEEGVGCLDEDRTDVNAAVADDAAVLADQLPRVESLHHFRGDTFLVSVAALSLCLSPNPQRWQHLQPRPVDPSPPHKSVFSSIEGTPLWRPLLNEHTPVVLPSASERNFTSPLRSCHR